MMLESFKYMKDASRSDQNFSSAQHLAVHTLFFSCIYQMRKLDVHGYLAFCSSRSFLSARLSPFFTVGLYIPISVAVDPARSIWKCPQHDLLELFQHLLRERVWRMKNIICVCFKFQRTFVISKPLHEGLCTNNLLPAFRSAKNTCSYIY